MIITVVTLVDMVALAVVVLKILRITYANKPFGGQGLSGTGPKAGGPNYLHSFVTEKTFTDNVMATGGNIDLLNKNNK